MSPTEHANRLPARTAVDRKRQPSGDDARERAMRAAMAAIAEKGAAKVRMSDIAERAGMSTGHILYHFGKKDRLLLEVLVWSEADLGGMFVREAGLAPSPAEKLAKFVEVYLPDHEGDERWALWTQVLSQRHDDEGKQLLAELTAVWAKHLDAIVTEGRALGRFAAVDTPEFVVRTMAMLDGLAIDTMFGHPRWKTASAQSFALTAITRELRPTPLEHP
ncbi:TetR/AcrR family transcriptional regulator [Embleya sp. MST-111070]|uniref:TetR/AcrR family transcriptional regulator n=1 Tax=Embleya sp. MST-111070 TaxID=3398231 RepID=UPI003F733A3F